MNWRAILLAFLLLCTAAWAATLKSPFHLTGTTVNAVDGTPIPFSRISVTLSATPSIPISATLDPALNASVRAQSPARQAGARGRRSAPSVILAGEAKDGDTQSVTSDAQGHFDINLPQAGSWIVRGLAPNYRSQVFEEHDGFSAAAVITESAPILNLLFRMTPNAVIVGKIFDEAGEPVQAAQVHAEPVTPVSLESTQQANEQPNEAASANTDDLGRYELAGLAAGSYRIKIQGHPWYTHGDPIGRPQANSPQPSPSSTLDPSLDVVFPATWFPGTTDENSAGIVTVQAGEEREVSLQLTPVPAAHLRIAGSDLVSESNQRVFVSLVADGAYTTTAARHGSDWEFGSLAPGSYELRLPGSNGAGGVESRHIQVRAGGPANLGFEASTALSKLSIALEGITSRAAPQVIFVNTKTGHRTFATLVARSGDLPPAGQPMLHGLELSAALLPGSYQVLLSGEASMYLASMSASGALVTGRVITLGDTIDATLKIHLATGRAAVSGVAIRQGKPLVGAMVLLVPATLGQPENLAFIERDETNTDGSFALAPVIPGNYILIAIADGWSLRWTDPQAIAPYLSRGVPIEVKPAAIIQQAITVQSR